MESLRISDLRERVGDVLGKSPPIAITQDQVDLFADATRDHQWIHVDVERAREGPFGGTIAQGFLTLSLLPALFAECVRLEDAETVINYGLNRVRFPAPVHVGSSVRLRVTLNDITEVDGGVQAVLGFEIGDENAPKPAAVGESIFRAYPRRAEE